MKGEIAVRYTIRHFDLPLLTFEANMDSADALLCRRDTAIAIDVHASPFWLKDNERHF